VIPAIQASRNGRVVALATRRVDAAATMAREHSIRRVYDAYERVVVDPYVDGVYLALVNGLHREWSERALRAGKHVLCEKPLALNADEAASMASTATRQKRLLMEAFMYRFHPRVRGFHDALRGPRFVHSAFGFWMSEPGNYRARPELGGGALLDVGSYCVNAALWLLGEPETVVANAHVEAGLDLTVSAALGFGGGRSATVWGSFESGERQLLVVVDETGPKVLQQPFTAWRDPDDPYQLMVEAFAAAALTGSAPPLLLEDSVDGLRVLDAIRLGAELGGLTFPLGGEGRVGL